MAQLKITHRSPVETPGDAIVILVGEERALTLSGKLLDHQCGGIITRTLEEENFLVKSRSVSVIYQGDRKVIAVALPPGNQIRATSLREAAYVSTRIAIKKRVRNLVIAFDPHNDAEIQAIGEGALLGTYRFTRYKTGDEQAGGPKKITVCTAKKDSRLADRARIFTDASFFVQDLVNEPPNELNPLRFARIAEEVAEERKLQIRIYEPPELAKLGANAFLSVGKGTVVAGRMCHLTYEPTGSCKAHVALVGKGLTFDSGGLSLKNEKQMEHMKSDMAGAATVLAVIRAAKELELPVKVTALLMVTENMPGGGANRPGDVIRAMNGKTIEITNTDAEGRLALADGLCFAEGLKPDYLLDIATLTGAQIIALGKLVGAVMGNNRTLVDRIIRAGEKAGEMFWPLPLVEAYKDLIRSDIADVKNSSGIPEAGAIQGGLFLSEFVTHPQWAHLDIAGPSWQDRDWTIYCKNGSGFGARCLLTFLEEEI